jgi:ABC-type glutathione transport system ATPase component
MRTSRGTADPMGGASPSSPSAHGRPVLEVVGLCGGFPTADGGIAEILHDVSFSVAAGSTTAIVGETGSGKTITALAIIGLLPPRFRTTGGSIWFEGDDLASGDAQLLRRVRGRRISMVFQDARASLNPVFSVGRQIADVCRLHDGVSRRQAQDSAVGMLERVRVPEARRRMSQYPHEFSGGMAQRAQLAMALACRPALLILDEPTTGLDVTIQADILDLVVDLSRERGMTTCIITHDLGVVAETCDSVVVMRSGEVSEAGSCEQILTRPQQDYTKALLADSTLEGLGR